MAVRSLRRGVARLLMLCMLAALASGCVPAAVAETMDTQETPSYQIPTDPGTVYAPTAMAPDPTPTPTASTPASPRLWISPALPGAFLKQFTLSSALPVTADRGAANIWVEIPTIEQSANSALSTSSAGDSTWIYALAAPFPTITDSVSAKMLAAAWQDGPQKALGGKPLLLTAETLSVLEHYWGPAAKRGVRVISQQALLETAWQEQSFALIPFEEIQPRWKILRVEDQSPLDKNFDPRGYPLAIPIWLTGSAEALRAALAVPVLPTNRDPAKLTVLTMTGVTALSRHIGERMETKGLTYPAEDIRPWLVDADLTHISNEVSFYEKCPKPGPERADMRFCSSPRYIALLEHVGADIIELTGNHILDWGVQPLLSSLEVYHQRGWLTYGGGADLEASIQPALIEHNGNRLAFIGCSPSGPPAVWARADRAGSAPCNFDQLEETIRTLRATGILPVVTLQAVETDTYVPAVAQGAPIFRRLAKAGAVIVSGSQSHIPQTMTFVENEHSTAFVHYGLGNLFFDQMKPKEARQEFIDRHVFYDGNYLGVELLTALLEDYAQPRPMRYAERTAFLEKIFSLSRWTEE